MKSGKGIFWLIGNSKSAIALQDQHPNKKQIAFNLGYLKQKTQQLYSR
jgi:hypothetical protein